MTSKGEIWSRGTNSCLPFDVNVMLNFSSTVGMSLQGLTKINFVLTISIH